MYKTLSLSLSLCLSLSLYIYIPRGMGYHVEISLWYIIMIYHHQLHTPNNTQHLNQPPGTTKQNPHTEHQTHPSTKPNMFRNQTPNTTTHTNRHFPNTERCSLPTLERTRGRNTTKRCQSSPKRSKRTTLAPNQQSLKLEKSDFRSKIEFVRHVPQISITHDRWSRATQTYSRDETNLLQQVGYSDFVAGSTFAPILTLDCCLHCADFQDSRPCILYMHISY